MKMTLGQMKEYIVAKSNGTFSFLAVAKEVDPEF